MAMPEIQRLRDGLPVHYDDCLVMKIVPSRCDCTATADVGALLKWVDEADGLLAKLQGPEDDGR